MNSLCIIRFVAEYAIDIQTPRISNIFWVFTGHKTEER